MELCIAQIFKLKCEYKNGKLIINAQEIENVSIQKVLVKSNKHF